MTESENLTTLIESVFKTTQILCAFYDQEMKPHFTTIINPTIKESAMFDAYQKMYWYLLSLSKLDNIYFFQTILNVVRSMFELSLDIICLNKDATDFNAEKYFEHSHITRFKMSQKVLEYVDKHPDTKIGSFFDSDFIDNMRNYVNQMKEGDKAKKLKEKYWPNSKGYPLYWSGVSCETFAEDMTMSEHYLRVYPIYSWFVHSGPSGFMSFDEKTMGCLFYYGHCEAHRIFLSSTRTFAEHCHISKVIPDFNDALMKLEALPHTFGIEAQKIK